MMASASEESNDGGSASEANNGSASEAATTSSEEGEPPDEPPDLALVTAAERLDLEEVIRLLRSGASAEFVKCDASTGRWGKTALHFAILAPPQSQDRLAVIEALVRAKADVNARTERSCWKGGCQKGRCLRQTAFDLALPSALRDPALLRLFLEHGADPNAKQCHTIGGVENDGYEEECLLNRAVKGGNLEVARALLEFGADANAADALFNQNDRGYHSDRSETALHIAAAAGSVPMARLLLEHRAEVDAVWRDLEQESLDVESPTDDPQDFVCSMQCRPVYKTALHLALEGGHGELATLLVCWGADTLARTVKKKEWHGACSHHGRKVHALFGVNLLRPERDDEWTSCEGLCREDRALLQALQAEYSEETHHLFPSQVRSMVKTVLTISMRQEWPIPEKVLFTILSFAVQAKV
mmetsp:Transcript_100817/g.217614  ORF Transcript_100817/g.217614 Transcript_100817/m.217614 type:complete len:415 (-) Transcript_100817:63-1307(-)